MGVLVLIILSEVGVATLFIEKCTPIYTREI